MLLRTHPSLNALLQNPWADLDAFGQIVGRLHSAFAEVSSLPVEVTQTEEGAEFVFEVPGVDAKAVQVEVEGRRLSVTVERAQPNRTGDQQVLRAERAYGTTKRRLELPFEIDRSAVRASLRDGLLTVQVTRADADRPRRIQVTQG